MSLRLSDISLTVTGQSYLSQINLEFCAGTFHVLLGRTGAGKTSLMRIIAGLEKPTDGQIWLNGQNITSMSVQKRKMSMVYQQFINYPHLTVWENIASPLRLAKVSASEIQRRVIEIAQLLHIEEFLPQLPSALSGGQQQRCAMARAMVKDAQVILFDEPLVNLDYKLRETLRSELKHIVAQRDSIAIYATTESQEALALAGNTTLLHQGSVLQSGPALSQFYLPKNIDAADLCHEPPLNKFVAEVKNNKLQLGSMIDLDHIPHLANLSDGEYEFALRPDHLRISAQTDQDIRIITECQLAEISASETYLHVQLNQLSMAKISWIAHLFGIHSYPPNTAIPVYFSLTDVYVFGLSGEALAHPPSPEQGIAEVKHG